MKFICEKCGIEFENFSECSEHEDVCGLPKDNICDFMLLRIYRYSVKVQSQRFIIPRTEASSRVLQFNVPGEDCDGDFRIYVETQNEKQGWKMLRDFALVKLAEQKKALTNVIKKFRALEEAKK